MIKQIHIRPVSKKSKVPKHNQLEWTEYNLKLVNVANNQYSVLQELGKLKNPKPLEPYKDKKGIINFIPECVFPVNHEYNICEITKNQINKTRTELKNIDIILVLTSNK